MTSCRALRMQCRLGGPWRTPKCTGTSRNHQTLKTSSASIWTMRAMYQHPTAFWTWTLRWSPHRCVPTPKATRASLKSRTSQALPGNCWTAFRTSATTWTKWPNSTTKKPHSQFRHSADTSPTRFPSTRPVTSPFSLRATSHKPTCSA